MGRLIDGERQTDAVPELDASNDVGRVTGWTAHAVAQAGPSAGRSTAAVGGSNDEERSEAQSERERRPPRAVRMATP